MYFFQRAPITCDITANLAPKDDTRYYQSILIGAIKESKYNTQPYIHTYMHIFKQGSQTAVLTHTNHFLWLVVICASVSQQLFLLSRSIEFLHRNNFTSLLVTQTKVMQKKAKMMNDKTGGHRGHRHIRFCASRTAAEWTDSRCLLITPMSNSNGICDLLSASIISSALQLTLFFYPGVFFHKPQIPPLHLVSFMEGLI